MTGLPAVYRPLNLHNEQPRDLSVHKHFPRFKKISQAHMVFSYLPFSFPSRGRWFIGNGNMSWTLPFNPYRGACCVSLDLYPNPVSLLIFWKQVCTSSAALLNLSKKLYCNCKSLEGEDGCLFVCVFEGLVSWEALRQGGFYLDCRERRRRRSDNLQ